MQKRITTAGLIALSSIALIGCGQSGQTDDASDGTDAPVEPVAVAPVEPVPVVDTDPVVESRATIGPRISFAKRVHDFGEIWDIERKACEFPFTNVGDGLLVISEVKPSCGCTATTLEQREFEPLEGSAIEVAFDPKGHGRQSKHIDVISNSNPGEFVRLVISADITEFIKAVPRYIKLGSVDMGKENRGVVSITSPDSGFVLESVRCNSPLMSARIIEGAGVSGPVREQDLTGEYKVEVTLSEDLPWGVFNGWITISGRGRLEPDGPVIRHSVTVSVNARLYGELRLSDDMFRLPLVEPGGPFEKRLHLTSRSGEPFSILDMEIRNPSIPTVHIRAEPIESSRESGYNLILYGESGDHRGSINGTIHITTDVAEEKELQIKFGGMVRRN